MVPGTDDVIGSVCVIGYTARFNVCVIGSGHLQTHTHTHTHTETWKCMERLTNLYCIVLYIYSSGSPACKFV